MLSAVPIGYNSIDAHMQIWLILRRFVEIDLQSSPDGARHDMQEAGETSQVIDSDIDENQYTRLADWGTARLLKTAQVARLSALSYRNV